mmetsp:Transcript_9353/g.14999  ORF Transcript_9353/g.14999 Transcript_9353/m.14999 type:complete len:232 (-) Transcript_9353:1617-2312(-)
MLIWKSPPRSIAEEASSEAVNPTIRSAVTTATATAVRGTVLTAVDSRKREIWSVLSCTLMLHPTGTMISKTIIVVEGIVWAAVEAAAVKGNRSMAKHMKRVLPSTPKTKRQFLLLPSTRRPDLVDAIASLATLLVVPRKIRPMKNRMRLRQPLPGLRLQELVDDAVFLVTEEGDLLTKKITMMVTPRRHRTTRNQKPVVDTVYWVVRRRLLLRLLPALLPANLYLPTLTSY